MKSLNARLSQLLLVVALVMPWTSIHAVDKFQEAGVITRVGYDTLTVDGKKYRVAPGASILINESRPGKLSDLVVGDSAAFSGQVVGGVHYVDSIVHHIIGDD